MVENPLIRQIASVHAATSTRLTSAVVWLSRWHRTLSESSLIPTVKIALAVHPEKSGGKFSAVYIAVSRDEED